MLRERTKAVWILLVGRDASVDAVQRWRLNNSPKSGRWFLKAQDSSRRCTRIPDGVLGEDVSGKCSEEHIGPQGLELILGSTMGMNYNGRKFRGLTNTPNGEVNEEKSFVYRQSGELLEASYSGGGIRCGQMAGLVFQDGRLEFCYQHLTDAGELRSGRCVSTPELLEDGRVRFHEKWRWTSGDLSEGESVVEEVR